MVKKGFNNLTKGEIEEAEEALDPFAFEKYCRVCIHYPFDERYDGECPFEKRFESGEFGFDTQWKNIGCNEFFD